MNNITFQRIALVLAITLSLVSVNIAQAATYTTISRQLGVGSSGNDVINLQTFLASNHDIYPQGSITGYFGALTRAAVMQFQVNYGLPMVGFVGPLTMAKINEVISKGYGIDIYAPTIYNTSVQVSSTSANFSWTTTESATGKVYYSTAPLSGLEATGNFTEPLIIGGNNILALSMQPSQSISAQNLQPHTQYYYIIEATDASGNVSVTNQATFTTNP